MNKLMISIFILVFLGLFLNLNAQVDLELSLSTTSLNPAIYSKVPLTYTITNTSETTATNVYVQLRVCGPIDNQPRLFFNETQVVNTSPDAVFSAGTYNKLSQVWTLPQVAANSSETITVNVFMLTEEPRTILGEIGGADQTDIDSSPANMLACNTPEDDEVNLVLNDEMPIGNEPCQLTISDVVFPSVIEFNVPETVEATITNDGTSASVPTSVDLYILQTALNGPGSIIPIQDGTIIPALGVGESTTIQFPVVITGLNNLNSFTPLPTLGNYVLVTAESATSPFNYLTCNGTLDFEVDFVDVDLELSWVDNEDCYDENFRIPAGLKITNVGNTTPTAFTYVSLGTLAFVDFPADDIVYTSIVGTAYWSVPMILEPGESSILEGVFKVPNNSNQGDYEINARIETDASAIEDTNPSNNTANQLFSFDENCGGGGGNPSGDIDLELNLTTTSPNPSPFSTVPLTYVVTNTSSTVATNVEVYLSICSPEENRPRLFFNEYGMVNSSTPAVASSGTYNSTTQTWSIPQVAAGSSASITIYVFTLTDEPRTLLGEVFRADQTDIDSSPSNLLTCTTNEDDEAGFVLNGNEPFECDYDNAQWINTLLNDEEAFCEDCYESINAYTLDGNTYIEFLAYNGCEAAATIVYNCDGTEFCTSMSLYGDSYRPCLPNFYEKNPVFVENIWSRTNCTNTNVARIQAHVWWDENGNGEKNFMDNGISQQLVQIEDDNNNIVAEGWTEENGYISFNGLAAGTYRVVFEPIDDAMVTFKNVQNTIESNDSDINPNSKTDFFTLSSNEYRQHVGAGFTAALIGNDIDLELSLSTPNLNPAIFTTIPLTYILTNTGTATATNIEVETGVCNPVFNRLSAFYQGVQVTNSSSPPPAVGTYNALADTWTIPQLEAGASATLIVNVFLLTEEERTILGEVTGVDQGDMDSAPTNMVDCNTPEDDEVSLRINGDSQELLPDLYVTNAFIFGGLTELNAGDEYELRYTPYNEFDEIAPAHLYDIFLSTDNNLSGDDILLEQQNSGVIQPNSGTSRTRSITIPAGQAAGNYFILIKTDSQEVVEESDESNNLFALPITVLNGVCTCEAVVEPVCGSDGITYQNACLAECAGVFDYTSGECPTADGIDLEMELIAPATFNIYTTITFQARVFNNGTVNAENVKVSFPLPDGFVHSSNSASHGAYDLFRETWNIGTLKVGETAILDLNLFALTSNSTTSYAQVSDASPVDVDSTPGNGTCCTPNEDDEAAVTIGSSFQGDNGSSSLTRPSTNREVEIKTLYPNIAKDEVTIFVQSKLPSLNLRVYNLQGHEVLQQKYQHTEGFQRLPLNVSELPTGTYFIRFDGTLGQETVRFVKVRM